MPFSVRRAFEAMAGLKNMKNNMFWKEIGRPVIGIIVVMVVMVFMIFADARFAGCSAPVLVKVVCASTGEPAEGILVKRRRPVNWWDKITNPVGATYHPYREAEACWTDAVGECVLTRFGPHDILDLYTTSNSPLNVTAGDKHFELSPSHGQAFLSYVYSLWVENGQVRFTVTEPSQDWSKEKVNKKSQYAL